VVDIAVVDEATKINPNASTLDELRGLLRAIGVDRCVPCPSPPRSLTGAGRGTLSVSGGLKADQYRAAGLPTGKRTARSNR